MEFSLISSTKKHLDLDQVVSVTIPTPAGEVGILPGHEPLVGAVVPGVLRVETDTETYSYALGGGVFETDGVHLEVLADMVDTGTGSTIKEIQAKKEEAQKLMQEAQSRGTIDAQSYIEAEQEFLKQSALEQVIHYH